MAVILRIHLSNGGKDTKYGNSETKDKGLELFRIKREKNYWILIFWCLTNVTNFIAACGAYTVNI